jgi:hypothetical protein
MASSAPSFRTARGSVDSTLPRPSQFARSEDSPPASPPPTAGDSTRTGGSHREVPQAVPRAEALDAKWQSAIDAATD